MSISSKELVVVNVENELKKSYLDYAMSVIVGRALPDARDGLKPVHRRVLFAMHELGNDYDKPYKKSARVVGDVIGKYHPHGDTAVYDTIVRMAQPFSLRYMLVDGQGNFGSVDGDSPAAMRYTEVRLSKIAHQLMSDLEKETVLFAPNYDGTEFAPTVMPTRIPNLLVNGSSGIAVGMATNIPTHNLTETINACIALLDNPQITLPEIMQYIKGPDFPTAGIITGKKGIIEAYTTGHGKIIIRARTNIEVDKKTGKESIIITELPYQVNKAKLQEKIGELVREKMIDGITGLRDESDKDGMRVVIEIRKGENSEVILNNLFNLTPMQSSFGINMVALENGQPKTFTLIGLLQAFISHRSDVVVKRTIFELRKARGRIHILEGLAIALSNIDEMIAIIKAAKTYGEAKENLLNRNWAIGPNLSVLFSQNANQISRPENLAAFLGLQENGLYRLSEEQAQAILDMRLNRLTGLEQDKIITEYKELLDSIRESLEILANPEKLKSVIKNELIEVRTNFGDARRTEIVDETADFTTEDLIPSEEVVITISHEGYTKIQALDEYSAQKRGGKGKIVTKMKDSDFVSQLLVADTHDTLLCFSNRGKVYWTKVYQLPRGNRLAKGKPLINLLPLQPEEKITAIIPVKKYDENLFVIMATAKGIVKKVKLTDFSNPRSSGIIAINLNDNDYLIGVRITDGTKNVMLFNDIGKVVRFDEKEIRCVGRTAIGVIGIKMPEDAHVVSIIIENKDRDSDVLILTATENGYGKRTKVADFRQTKRGAMGVISIQVDDRNGKVVSALPVSSEKDELMLISNKGTLVRTRVKEISVVGRNTKGVKLINLDHQNEEKLIGMELIANDENEEEEN